MLRALTAPRTVLAFAAVVVWVSGRWRPLARQFLEPMDLLIGLAAGVPLLFLSLTLVQGPARGAQSLLFAFRDASRRGRGALVRAGELGLRASWEEAFWRGTLQVLWGNGLLGILSAAGLFASRHLYLEALNRRAHGVRQTLELVLFSLVLGLVYARTDRILLAVGIHWTRNLLLDAASVSRAASLATKAREASLASVIGNNRGVPQ